MSKQALWVSVSPTLKRFHQPLLSYLSRQATVREWEYKHAEDDPCTLDIPLTLLHDYLKNQTQPVHLLGHSTGGLLALLYAERYPARVKSLTLLGVGVYPLIDWHAHYYTYRQLLPCSREIILGQMVKALFGNQDQNRTKGLVHLLEKDLELTPVPHSLIQCSNMTPKEITAPLMICGSEDDVIVDPGAIKGWEDHLKPEDRIWNCPQGHHFFHYHHRQLVGEEILNFLQQVELKAQIFAMNHC